MSVTLTESQLKAFAAVNQRLGLGPDESTFSGEDLAARGERPVIMSSDPFESHIPPKLVPVASIAELNRMVGISDENDDSHVEYPKPVREEHLNLLSSAASSVEFHQGLGDYGHEIIKRAAVAYVMGDSRKVKDYEPLINACMFPGQIAVFTAIDITVTKENPLIIWPGDPQIHNYGVVTVKPGGYIRVMEHAKFTSQQFIVE